MSIPNPLPAIQREQVMKAIKDDAWQDFRKSLKGLSTKEKISKLNSWYRKGPKARIQVINYMGALLRGGQVKKGQDGKWRINR